MGYFRQVDIDETRYPELIINLAKNSEFIARADIVQLLHVSSPKAYTLLKKLVEQDLLEPVNKGHYAKYKYIGKWIANASNAFDALDALATELFKLEQKNSKRIKVCLKN